MTDNITVSSVNLLTDVVTKLHTLPDGYDAWAIRSVHPDLVSRDGYRYPWPGNVAKAPGPILDHEDDCPRESGDGICAALDWRGMASGAIPAITLLLVAYRQVDVLGGSASKLRLREFLIVDVIDGARLLRRYGHGANLRGADLQGSNLRGADLRGADLYGAYLQGSNLRCANLRCASLQGANLRCANLQGADLRGADLRGASGFSGYWEVSASGLAMPKGAS